MDIFTFAKHVRELEDLYFKIRPKEDQRSMINNVLGYFRSFNAKYRSNAWVIAAGKSTTFLSESVPALDKKLHAAFNSVLNTNPTDIVYDNHKIPMDISHMLATLDGYYDNRFVPKVWLGWAGDLATAMADTTKHMKGHSSSAKKSASIIVGNDTYSCGITDLRADADPIGFIRDLSMGKPLSYSLEDYYSKTLTNDKVRFNLLIDSITYDEEDLEKNVKSIMTSDLARTEVSIFGKVVGGLLPLLGKNPSEEVIDACCKSFSSYFLSIVNH